jgi:general secretion pathway protein E
VFTTVHANNVFDVIGRFTHMGVDPYSFVGAERHRRAAARARELSALHGRRCPDRRIARRVEPRSRRSSPATCSARAAAAALPRQRLPRRKAITEMLLLTDEMRELITAKEPIRKVKEVARASGTRFLRENAIDLVRDGITSLEEANRVTFVA